MTPTMRRPVLALAIGACSSQPGDPSTFVHDGKTIAGYAWSGPYSELADYPYDSGYVGWQVWFTNTDYCPTTGSEGLGSLVIVTPELVYKPSTQLPTLASPVLPIVLYDTITLPPGITAPEAIVYGQDFASISGTLTLSTFNEDEVAGSFDARVDMPLESSNEMHEAHGTFVAPRCARIHDY